MRQIRQCAGVALNTGASACPIAWGKVKGAIIVERGQKLPASLTYDALEELAHQPRPARIYPVKTFVEFAKEGGEMQVAAVGYGGNKASGMNALTETFTLDEFYDSLNAGILKSSNYPFDVYFWDEKNVLYGVNDGTDVLAGIPMSTVYTTPTEHPTSSAAATMTISFAFADAQGFYESFDYVQMPFSLKTLGGLVEVEWAKVGDGKYKAVERYGGYDRTPLLGDAIAKAAQTLFKPAPQSCSYADGVLTVVPAAQAAKAKAGEAADAPAEMPSIVDSAALYAAGVKGVEFVDPRLPQ